MPNPWDVKPCAPHGDAEPKIIFTCVGEVLTEWSNVETSCAEIFGIFVSAPKRDRLQAPAVRAYGSVSSFSQQCQLLQEAGAVYFHKHKSKSHLSSRLDKFITECKNYVGRRNEIAHGHVVNVFQSKYKTGKGMKSIGYYLLPTFYNPKKYKIEQGVTYQYVSGDTIHYRQEFTKLYLRVAAYRDDLAAR
jgi:hypothetical protein